MTAMSSNSKIPLLYRVFFLYIEPISALIGAFYAHVLQESYISLTHDLLPAAIAPTTPLPAAVSIALSQLGNLYLLFAINEAVVLRASSDRHVWRAVLTGLLIADLGHLWACKAAGWDIYWRITEWNAMWMGNLGFVYCGMAMRIAFLMGVGLVDAGRRVKVA